MANPSSPIEQCMQEVSHPKITLKANGRVATFRNPDGCLIKKVDLDCLLAGSSPTRADYVVCHPGVVDVIIELKGKDIDHAIKQIIATVAIWKGIPPFSQKLGALVVFTRCPERSATLGELKKRLLEKYDLWLEMGKNELKEYEFKTFAQTAK